MKDDRVYIYDMAKSCRQIMEYVSGKTEQDLLDNVMLFDAIVRQYQVLGEAASKVSPLFKDSMPDVDWRGIIGMRNVIIHDYSVIEIPRILQFAREDVPPLLSLLEPHMRKIEEELEQES